MYNVTGAWSGAALRTSGGHGYAARIILGALVTAFAAVTPLGAQSPDTGITNCLNVSWGDQIMVATGDEQLDEPDKIKRSMRLWQEDYAVKTVLWRASSYYLKEFYVHRQSGDFIRRYYRKVAEVTRRFEPMTVARQAAADHEMALLLYMTIFDHGAPEHVLYAGTTPFPWQDRAMIEHPEWQTVDLRGTPHWGVLEMAYPEARNLMIERMTGYVDRFKSDGLYVCTRTHSLPAQHADQFGFSPPIVAEYGRRHGIDITKDPRFDWTDERYAPGDPDLEAWRDLRGEYLIEFFRELRRALPRKTIYAGIPRGDHVGPPYGNMTLDWRSIVREKLVDGLIVGVHSGKWLHKKLYVPHADIGYLCSEDDGIGIPSRSEAVEQYGPLCRQHGIELFLQGRRGAAETQLARQHPALTGFMLYTPSVRGAACVQRPPSFADHSVVVEAFVYSDEASDAFGSRWPRILSQYDHSDADRLRGWEWVLRNDGTFRFRVNFHDPGTQATTEVALDSPDPFPTERWVHVATVIDRTQDSVRILFDGTVVAETACPSAPVRSTPMVDLWLGRYAGVDSHHFRGRLDALHIRIGSTKATVPQKPPRPGSNTALLCQFDRIDGKRLVAAPPTLTISTQDSPAMAPSMPGFGTAIQLGK